MGAVLTLAAAAPVASLSETLTEQVRPKGSLLFLAPYVPDPRLGGSSVRVHGHLSVLSRHFDVVLVVLSDHPDRTVDDVPADIRKSVRRVLFHRIDTPSAGGNWRERIVRALPFGQLLTRLSIRPELFREFLDEDLAREIGAQFRGERFDAVHASRIATLPLLRHALRNLAERPARIVLDLDDLESKAALRRARSLRATMGRQIHFLHRMDASKFAYLERRCLQTVDAIGLCSALDRDEFNRRHATTRAEIIPNAVRDPGLAAVPAESERRPTLLFVGNFGFYPNMEAVTDFIANVLPLIRRQCRQEFVVKLVGRGAARVAFDAAANPEIAVHDNVPDLGPYYRDASVVIAPIRSGGGTRIKIVEAFSYGKAVVSTTIGAEGLDVTDGENILLRDNHRDLADICVSLLGDRDRQKRLGEAGRKLYLDKYSPLAIENTLVGLYRK